MALVLCYTELIKSERKAAIVIGAVRLNNSTHKSLTIGDMAKITKLGLDFYTIRQIGWLHDMQWISSVTSALTLALWKAISRRVLVATLCK